MKLLKTIFSLFLLSIFFLNVVGYYLFFEISDIQIKEQMAETISKSNESLVSGVIAMPVNSFGKENDNDEVWYNNRLYDVVKKEVRNDSVFVYVINDPKEEHLINKLEEHVERNFDNVFHQNTSRNPVKGFSKGSFPKYVLNSLSVFSVGCSGTAAYFPSVHLHSIYSHFVLTPPPETVS